MIEITRKTYDSDLTDDKWEAIAPLFGHLRNFKWPKFYSRAEKSGLWDEILQFLVEITRQIEDRNAHPSYAIIDSQNVKTIDASKERGINGGKKMRVSKL